MTPRASSLARPLAALAVCAVLSTPAGSALATKACLAVGQAITNVVVAPLVHDLSQPLTTTTTGDAR